MQRQVRRIRNDWPGHRDLSRRQLLGNLAAFALAASTSGSQSSPILALARSAAPASDPTVDPKDFGAKGDGHTDDASALQAALNTGKRVSLRPGLDYAFGAMLRIPDGGGFVGGGLLTMLTGPGKFDKADYSGAPEVGLFVDSVSNVSIEARIRMQTSDGIRTCSAIWVRGCSNVELDVEAWGFKETRFGVIEWNSNRGGTVKANVHDCFVDSTRLPTMQVTALSVDSNRLGVFPHGVNSTGLRFDVTAKDIHFGPAAIAKYGYQTDAVNLQGSGYAGHSGEVVAENVHEPLDCWSDQNTVKVTARDCLFGVKLIYGASRNLIHATVERFMKDALLLGGSNTKPVAYNRCYISAADGGEIGKFGDVAAVAAEGGGGRFAPDHNTVEVSIKGNGVDLDYGILVSNGASNNSFRISGSGYAVSQGRIARTAGRGNSIVQSTVEREPRRKPEQALLKS
jgi:hypothetical protein